MLEILSRFLEPVGVAAISKQTTVAGALGAVRELRPDLLLLDLRDLEEVGSIGEARELVPALKTIVLVDPGDESVLAAARAAGATVVISRAASRDDLAVAVRQAFEPSDDSAQNRATGCIRRPARASFVHRGGRGAQCGPVAPQGKGSS